MASRMATTTQAWRGTVFKNRSTRAFNWILSPRKIANLFFQRFLKKYDLGQVKITSGQNCRPTMASFTPFQGGESF